MTITRFFERILHARRTNHVWSWGAIDAYGRVFLMVWDDQIYRDDVGRKIQVARKNPTVPSLGIKERCRHIEAIKKGAQAFGVLCTARKLPEGRRKILKFDNSLLLRLGLLSEDDERVYAEIVGRIPTHEVVSANSTSPA